MLAKRNQYRHDGLTIVEVMVSSLLVGLVLVASLNTLGNVSITRRNAVSLQVGPCLANHLMSEILQKAYADPETSNASIGLDASENSALRRTFDDIDDYDGWVQASPLRDDGTALGYAAGWKREVSVEHVDIETLATSSSATGLKRIFVSVTSPDGATSIQEALRSSWGMIERPPSKDQSYLSAVKIRLQTSDLGTDVVMGTAIRNHGIDQ